MTSNLCCQVFNKPLAFRSWYPYTTLKQLIIYFTYWTKIGEKYGSKEYKRSLISLEWLQINIPFWKSNTKDLDPFNRAFNFAKLNLSWIHKPWSTANLINHSSTIPKQSTKLKPSLFYFSVLLRQLRSMTAASEVQLSAPRQQTLLNSKLSFSLLLSPPFFPQESTNQDIEKKCTDSCNNWGIKEKQKENLQMKT